MCHRLCVLVVACFYLAGCNQQPVAMSRNTPILKIAVMADGRLTVDGSPATMESLHSSLKRLADQQGVVWYYREAGDAQPSPQAAEVSDGVIKAAIENRLPIRLSRRPDYSDSIGMDGRPTTK
jgi:hypothetical protein